MTMPIYRFFLAVLISCISLTVYGDPNDNAATLNVRGEAVLMVAPDQVTLSIGVISEAKKADAALSENSEKMRGAIALLESLSFSDEDYQTQRFSIRPKWSNRTSAGVNQIQSIQFGLKSPRQYREQAITQASNNAKADGTALAKANGLRLTGDIAVRASVSIVYNIDGTL